MSANDNEKENHKQPITMKKLLLVSCIATALMMAASCEHSDCVCRYYDKNGTTVAQEDWDGSQISASQCEEMENNKVVEVDNQTVIATNVSCSTEW